MPNFTDSHVTKKTYFKIHCALASALTCLDTSETNVPNVKKDSIYGKITNANREFQDSRKDYVSIVINGRRTCPDTQKNAKSTDISEKKENSS